MRFIPKPHGEFKLRWQGDVFVVEYIDTWNDITARAGERQFMNR